MPLGMAFHDREQAGHELARRLRAHAHRPDTLVLALPRGGVPIGLVVAKELGLPLDLLVVEKVRVPGEPLAILGAVSACGVRVIDRDLARAFDLPDERVEQLFRVAEEVVEERERLYRRGRPPLDLRGKTVVVVDDGVATGASLRAAVSAAERMGPSAIVTAVPISTYAVCAELSQRVSESICLIVRDPVYALHLWYDELPRVSDEEVIELMSRHWDASHPGSPAHL